MRTTRLLLAAVIIAGYSTALAAGGETKSELVKNLESLFYDSSFAAVAEKVFSVADYGVKGDGKTLDTSAIQKTIDAAAAVGGGIVTFPQGTYLCGAIFMKSNTELRIDKGVVIQAIQDDSKYPEMPTRIAGVEMTWPAALINVYEQENVRITGKGVIDGNGSYWWYKFWGKDRKGGMLKEYRRRGLRWAADYDCKRVRPVVVWKSKNVLLKDFTVKRSGFWTISVVYSDRVYIDGLIIRNNIGGHGPSSDGVNTDSSSNVLVENCDIDCNDDNLCLKSGKDADGLRVNRPAENIVYRNCITQRGHGVFTLGSETSGGMRNIEVYGLKANGTSVGIRFKSAKVRGGVVENVYFHDIEMDRVGTAFQFNMNWYPQYSYPKIPDDIPQEEIKDHWHIMTRPVMPPERGIPEFRNLRFANITVKNSTLAFDVNAYPEKPIHDLTWKNISIEAKTAGAIRHAKDWKMENVKMKAMDGKPLKLENCGNVDVPSSLK